MEKPRTLQKIAPVTELRLSISSIQGNGMIPCFQIDTLKRSVIEIIYSEAARTGKPVFCIVDDTIAGMFLKK